MVLHDHVHVLHEQHNPHKLTVMYSHDDHSELCYTNWISRKFQIRRSILSKPFWRYLISLMCSGESIPTKFISANTVTISWCKPLAIINHSKLSCYMYTLYNAHHSYNIIWHPRYFHAQFKTAGSHTMHMYSLPCEWMEWGEVEGHRGIMKVQCYTISTIPTCTYLHCQVDKHDLGLESMQTMPSKNAKHLPWYCELS